MIKRNWGGEYIVLTSTEFGLPPADEFVGWGASPIPCLMLEGEKMSMALMLGLGFILGSFCGVIAICLVQIGRINQYEGRLSDENRD